MCRYFFRNGNGYWKKSRATLNTRLKINKVRVNELSVRLEEITQKKERDRNVES